MVGVEKYTTICPKCWATIIQNLRPELLLPFQKQQEDSVTILASPQERQLIKKVNNILIQAATS
jgi:hypothetical protein